MPLRVLCVGPQFRGSNAFGMFKAFSKLGHIIEIVDENYYLGLNHKNTFNKAIDKLMRSRHITEFNQEIINQFLIFMPDLVLVYKGAFVLPDTIKMIKGKRSKVVNFYPDVSFHTHGDLLPVTLPMYDCVFTTKTFGLSDMKNQLGITNSFFIPHGYDEDIHRPLDTDNESLSEIYNCDASFIGTYSPKKEEILSDLFEYLPTLDLKIWGNQWGNCKRKSLKKAIQYKPIQGDSYSLGIQNSKINLGILSEMVEGASSGDQITSRTFHIPAAGGFMIHEKTEEINNYFKEGEEIVCFSDKLDLVEKIEYYLKNEHLREEIRINGMYKTHKDHNLKNRVQMLLGHLYSE